jgi:hypothetical protein
MGNIAVQITPLVRPISPPVHYGQSKHFTWSNANKNDKVPVCASIYDYEGDTTITAPFDGEIFCIETDGAASTVWRFAHNRAIWVAPYFNTQPLARKCLYGRKILPIYVGLGWSTGDGHSWCAAFRCVDRKIALRIKQR